MDTEETSPTNEAAAQFVSTETESVPCPSSTRRPSSITNKDDPIYQCILRLWLLEQKSDMPALYRCGLANNIHFLVMRNLRDEYGARTISGDAIALEVFSVKNHHQAIFTLDGTSERGSQAHTAAEGIFISDTGFMIAGNMVKHESHALDSLRETVDMAIHLDWETNREEDESMGGDQTVDVLLAMQT
ncbi:hypothetical protein FB567DRAFT_550876 [Paraphoma chrysanthemicola]|uniref:Uncharacterized protein n=1 Tax=Paraphoma chrysanthemicola TaxID=798071 RepID=A0A8K0VWD0_9PLEO|nr:hypothetical protein FB567DRAFT_550876 [Paraphoma chrysanthemicola]